MDDKLAQTFQAYIEELTTEPGHEILLLAIAEIPYAGGAITRLLFGDAQKRVAERAREIFEAVKERLEVIEEEKIDKSFFQTEEFMTLFALTIEQLQTTHDREKLLMLANGLAQSKENYITQ